MTATHSSLDALPCRDDGCCRVASDIVYDATGDRRRISTSDNSCQHCVHVKEFMPNQEPFAINFMTASLACGDSFDSQVCGIAKPYLRPVPPHVLKLTSGCGGVLHSVLLFLGFQESEGCDCGSVAVSMDTRGAWWSLINSLRIARKMQLQYKTQYAGKNMPGFVTFSAGLLLIAASVALSLVIQVSQIKSGKHEV